MGDSYLGQRLRLLRAAQNDDGGWGYFPGKQSWLEPTCYAALALHGEAAADRAWEYLRGLQRPDGAWRPKAGVDVAHAGTALCVTVSAARQDYGRPMQQGVTWLLQTSGAESRLGYRLVTLLTGQTSKRDLTLKGWPWKSETSSWVEPTALALVALKQASTHVQESDRRALNQRVGSGEAQLLNVRCSDGGWNYGNADVLGVDLFSYPETTGIALVGLQGASGLGEFIDRARRSLETTSSPLALAWLSIALRLHKAAVPENTSNPPPSDLQIVALEALAASGGNYNLFGSGVTA